tara:strand:+ start:17749 stop:18126 length:378 start_codon:yes stop_codon:yes gene_type:complete
MQEKRTRYRIIFGRIGILVLLVTVAFFAKGVWGVYEKARFAREARDAARNELTNLTTRETALSSEIRRLETQRGLEEEIRQKYDVGRRGEQMIVLVDAPEPDKVYVPPQPTIWERVVIFLGLERR